MLPEIHANFAVIPSACLPNTTAIITLSFPLNCKHYACSYRYIVLNFERTWTRRITSGNRVVYAFSHSRAQHIVLSRSTHKMLTLDNHEGKIIPRMYVCIRTYCSINSDYGKENKARAIK